MTIKKLHEITGHLIAQHLAESEVVIDFDSFRENENGTLLHIQKAGTRPVQGADDSGPVDDYFDMLVLSGTL